MNNDENCLPSYVSLNIPSQDVCSGQPACGGGITNNKKGRGGDFFCCFHLFLLLFSFISFVVFIYFCCCSHFFLFLFSIILFWNFLIWLKIFISYDFNIIIFISYDSKGNGQLWNAFHIGSSASEEKLVTGESWHIIVPRLQVSPAGDPLQVALS